MDRLEITFHIESRTDGEETVDTIARQLEEHLPTDAGVDEPVFVSKASRGPFMTATLICHVQDAEKEWEQVRELVITDQVSGDVEVRKIAGTNESSELLYSHS